MHHHCSHAAGKPLGTRAMFMMFEEKEKILKIPQNINSGDEMNIFLPKLMKKGRVQLFKVRFLLLLLPLAFSSSYMNVHD